MSPTSFNTWAWLSWAYGALVVCTVGYALLGIPIQVTDSYGNLVQASQGSLMSLVEAQFHQRAYLRPFLWANLRIVYDLSGGDYFTWFRGWHVAQVALLVALFLRLVRPRTLGDAAVVPLGLATLIGIHTFAGTVSEAFPINTFMTIVLCTLAAADLALSPPRWWRDVAAAALFVFAALTVESGLLVTVVFVAARMAGARGVSLPGVLAQCALFVGYFVLRFALLGVGAPGLEERSSGFGFSRREPEDLIALFGGGPLPFYAYNVVASLASVLFSEPSSGVFELTRRILLHERLLPSAISVASSLLATTSIVLFVWKRREAWRHWRLERGDQLVFVFAGVLAANAAMSYAYTKDVILSPAGAFYAVAVSTAVSDLVSTSVVAPVSRRLTVGLLLVSLSAGWAFRGVGLHLDLRHAGEKVRKEWAYVEQWLEQEGQVLTDPHAIALKEQLQDDAIRRHPSLPPIVADWAEWFAQ